MTSFSDRAWCAALVRAVAVVIATAALIAAVTLSHANWTGPTDPAMHKWFDGLASGKGLCCSFADGVSVLDVDWDTTKDGHYRVRLNGQWVIVPDAAVVTEPNKFGPAVVWPYQDMNGVTQIRCFIPGAGA